jgi:hypothetical protein
VVRAFRSAAPVNMQTPPQMPQKRGRGASTLLQGDAPKKRPRSVRVMNNEELWAMLLQELEEVIAELEELCK